MAPVSYILLDCDNTLCKSEHRAFTACTKLINEVLKKYGVVYKEDQKNEDGKVVKKEGEQVEFTVAKLLHDYVGYNFRKMLQALRTEYGFPMTDEELEAYVDRELGAVIQALNEECFPCKGVPEQLEWAKQQGYPMSVVSTSAKPRVVASLKKAGIDHYFKDEHVYSAATSMEKPSSKPDPAIYNFACEKLGVKNKLCVTVEDSKSGATAARSAGIPCIGYVGIYGEEEGQKKMEQMADLLKNDEKTQCAVIMYDWKEFPECLKKIESMISSS